jgi:hypothetical protein
MKKNIKKHQKTPKMGVLGFLATSNNRSKNIKNGEKYLKKHQNTPFCQKRLFLTKTPKRVIYLNLDPLFTCMVNTRKGRFHQNKKITPPNTQKHQK